MPGFQSELAIGGVVAWTFNPRATAIPDYAAKSLKITLILKNRADIIV
jgi:hypothetical protein